jgi:hypothetical protein
MPAIVALVVAVILAVILIKVMLWIAGVAMALAVGVFIYFFAEKLVGKGN